MTNHPHIFFLGIGGIGMSALAHYALNSGYKVSGYDAVESFITKELIESGAKIYYKTSEIKFESEVDYAIYTPAISPKSPEYQIVIQENIPLKKRSEALQEILKDYQVYAIAGTHGKTSVSGLLGFILNSVDPNNGAFIGGWLFNWDSNFKPAKKGHIVVVEADEFDRSFHRLNPNCIGVTAMDPDHLEIYGNYEGMIQGYEEFIQKLQPNGTLIFNSHIAHSNRLAIQTNSSQSYYSYGNGDWKVSNLMLSEIGMEIEITAPSGEKASEQLPIYGEFNADNICLAVAMANQAGVSPQTSLNTLRTFKGVRRRLQLHLVNEKFHLFEDYAHHPVEVTAAIKALKAHFQDSRIAIAFQPHLYTRTRDLAPEFAQSLSAADSVYIHSIYPAREEPIEQVSSKLISQSVEHAIDGENEADLSMWINNEINQTQHTVLCLMGAGDFTKYLPTIFQQKGGQI